MTNTEMFATLEKFASLPEAVQEKIQRATLKLPPDQAFSFFRNEVEAAYRDSKRTVTFFPEWMGRCIEEEEIVWN